MIKPWHIKKENIIFDCKHSDVNKRVLVVKNTVVDRIRILIVDNKNKEMCGFAIDKRELPDLYNTMNEWGNMTCEAFYVTVLYKFLLHRPSSRCGFTGRFLHGYADFEFSPNGDVKVLYDKEPLKI